MNSSNDAQIDEAILAITGTSWRKIASVIFRVAGTIGDALPQDEAGYDRVAKRIEVLIRGGHLLAQGDIKKWRHSEVRKPS
jgi:hypothetical protein